ncbi:MAG: lipase [Moraxellaceae bacterium]|nr:MAG: lipase [Moraxellaceae bacterium]
MGQSKKTLHNRIIGSVAGMVMATVAGFSHAATTTEPAAPTDRLNKYPIVLVHGFFGWGRDEVLGVKHFGGLRDIQKLLMREEGHKVVVTPAMGPISSSWDRACELYAQLMGTQVDYGKAHSAEYGHERFGRDHRKNPNKTKINLLGAGQKVNLLAHSQGVQTGRVLIELLRNGSQAEMAVTSEADLSDFFKGGNQWVHSIAALSGANDGSAIAHGIYNQIGGYEKIITLLINVVNTLSLSFVYDFKLEQFGLENKPFWKNPLAYMKEITGQMYHRKDSAFYDLSAQGAAEINAYATMEEDVFYYSWANQSSELQPDGTHRWAENTNFILAQVVNFMGNYEYSAPGMISMTSESWPNDGITSTRSMSAPINWSTDTYVDYDGSPVEPGVWNYMGKLEGNWDHWDMLNLLDPKHDVVPLYYNAANFLASTEGEGILGGSIDWLVLLGFGGLAAFRKKTLSK